MEPAGETTEPMWSVSHCHLLPSLRAGVLSKGDWKWGLPPDQSWRLVLQVYRQEKGTDFPGVSPACWGEMGLSPSTGRDLHSPRACFSPAGPGWRVMMAPPGCRFGSLESKGCQPGGESQMHRMALWQEQEQTGASVRCWGLCYLYFCYRIWRSKNTAHSQPLS